MGSAWRNYQDLVLKFEPAAEGRYRVEASGPGGEAESEFSLPFTPVEVQDFIQRAGQGTAGGPGIQPILRDFGQRLFNAIFNGRVRDLFIGDRRDAERSDRGLRLKLRLDSAPALASLPWEFLHDGRDFLNLSDLTPILRYHDLAGPPRPLQVDLPMRILVTTASPSGYDTLDAGREQQRIRQALGGLEDTGQVTIDFIDGITLPRLQQALRQARSSGRPYHVWHFIGHGGFDEDLGEGQLAFLGEGSKPALVSGAQIGTLFGSYREMRLALINACEGSRSSIEEPTAGVAMALVERGLPAVVGMQFLFSDSAALRFSEEFYTALVDGLPVDAAMAEARRAVFIMPNPVEWATPVLFMRVEDGQLFKIKKVRPSAKAKPAGPAPQAEPVVTAASTPQLQVEKHPATPISPPQLAERSFVGVTSNARQVTLTLRSEADGLRAMLDFGPVIEASFRYSTAELVHFDEEARQALVDIVFLADEEGRFRSTRVYRSSPKWIYQTGIDIPEPVRDETLFRLAKAGSLLVKRIFFPPSADSQAINFSDQLLHLLGEETGLRVKIVTNGFSIPWQMLYLAQDWDPDHLEPDQFLGLRHALRLVPFSTSPYGRPSPPLHRSGGLRAGIYIDPQLDTHMSQPIAANQLRFWQDLAAEWIANPTIYTTRDDAHSALISTDNQEAILYFFTRNLTGKSADHPDGGSIGFVWPPNEDITVEDLQLHSSARSFLAAGPLVMLNTNQTALRVSPSSSDLTSYFFFRGARAIVGVETELPALLASEAGMRYCRRFLSGESASQALLNLRRELYDQHNNLLGLLYELVTDGGDLQIEP